MFISYSRVCDLNNQKRRLFLSTTHREMQKNPLHSKIPLSLVHKGKVGIDFVLCSVSLGELHFQTLRTVKPIKARMFIYCI